MKNIYDKTYKHSRQKLYLMLKDFVCANSISKLGIFIFLNNFFFRILICSISQMDDLDHIILQHSDTYFYKLSENTCFYHVIFNSVCFIVSFRVGQNLVFGQKQFARHRVKSETNHLLFYNNSILSPTPFRHIFNLPLNFCSEKNKVNKKAKFTTSQKCKDSKKYASSSIHNF